MLDSVQGWHITIVVVIVGFIMNYAAMRVGFGKDIKTNTGGVEHNAQNITVLFDENKSDRESYYIGHEDKVSKADCKEDRDRFEKHMQTMKNDLTSSFARLDEKFDKKILNGG